MRQHLSLILLAGSIGIFLIILGLLSYVKSDAYLERQKEQANKLSDKTVTHITSSDVKMREAEELLSKKNSTKDEQEKAIHLIEESIISARKAATEQPDNPKTWVKLSDAYFKVISVNANAAKLAEDAITHAIKLADPNAELYNKRATAFIYEKDYAAAAYDLEEAIRLSPNSAQYYYLLGNVYRLQKQKEKARTNYVMARKLTLPNNTKALQLLDTKLKEIEK